MHFIKPDLSLR